MNNVVCNGGKEASDLWQEGELTVLWPRLTDSFMAGRVIGLGGLWPAYCVGWRREEVRMGGGVRLGRRNVVGVLVEGMTFIGGGDYIYSTQ